MFGSTISSTPFCAQDAEQFFSRIYGNGINCDVTMVSTLRALLYPRLSENDTMVFRFVNIYRQNLFDVISSAKDEATYQFILASAVGDESGYQAGLKRMGELEGFAKLDRVGKWMESQKFKCEAFYEQDEHCVVVIAKDASMQFVHLVQGIIPVLMPWFFKDKPIDDDEKALLQSLGRTNFTDYGVALNKLAERYDLRAERIKSLLDGFEKVKYKRGLDKVRRQIEENRYELQRLQDNIASYLEELDKQYTIEAGYMAKIDGECDNEVMYYFLNNKDLDLEEVSDNGTITFVARGYCDTFDPEKAEVLIENQRSDFYSNCERNLSKAQMRKLLRAIFITQEIKLRFCAAYSFRNGYEVRGYQGYDYSGENITYMPNQHIDRYGCIGNYMPYINQYLEAGNYIGALEQASVSCRSLNFNDSAVMNATIYWIDEHAKTRKVFELPDGTIETAYGVLNYLSAEENK